MAGEAGAGGGVASPVGAVIAELVISGAVETFKSRRAGRKQRRQLKQLQEEVLFPIVRSFTQTRPRTNAEWQEYWTFLRGPYTPLELIQFLQIAPWTQAQRQPGQRTPLTVIRKKSLPRRPAALSFESRSVPLGQTRSINLIGLSLPERLRMPEEDRWQ